LFPRPDYWPASAHITGYAERPKTGNWQPDEALTAFLNQHPKVLFVTFGSMVNTDPEAKTQALLRVIIKYNIPTIINTSWGGLVEQQVVPDHVFYTNNVPYDALFPRIYAVVHHGGSGTTHTAIKYGCASLIIPHIMDQFFWNRLIAKQGAGPLGIPIKKLTESRIEPLLHDLWTEASYKQNAQRLAESMARENADHNLVRALCS
ncbi:MAG: glycosyltransferase, partial [Bacteroidota bacterium]